MRRLISILFLGCCMAACSSSGTNSTTATPLTTAQKTTAQQALASALSSIFTQPSSSNNQTALFSTTPSCDSNDPGCTCESIRSGQSPLFVKATPHGTAATYGSNNDAVTLATSDFCDDGSGNQNSGSGPDSNGLFGSFELRDDVSGSCSSDTLVLEEGSGGVFRNDSSGNVTLYGSFEMTLGSSSSTLNCTLTLDSTGTVSSADCTDSSNTTIVSDTSQTCSLEQTTIQDSIGGCDVWGQPNLTDTTETEYVVAQLDNYASSFTFVRPHRANGHVFSYNIVDEDEDGTYDWSLPDDVVTETQSRNMRLFINIYPEADDGEFDADTEGYAVKIIELPSNLSGYSTFVQTMVERYDGDGYNDMSGLEIPIKHWAVANEPHCDTDDSDVASCHADILSLLETTYDAIKAADSDAIVFMGGAAPLFDRDGNKSDDVDELYQYLFDNGGLDHMDRLAFHTAVGVTNPDIGTYVGEYNTMMGSDAVPLWLTETGSRDVDDATLFDSDISTEWSLLETHMDDTFDAGVEKIFLCNMSGMYEETDTLTSGDTFWETLTDYLDDL